MSGNKTAKTMNTYKNSFYRREQHLNNPYVHETITAISKPIEYNGFDIYKITHLEYHIVKDGVCVGMVGSIDYAKKRIDTDVDSLLKNLNR